MPNYTGHRDVPCPECGARVNQGCRSWLPFSTRTLPHPMRVERSIGVASRREWGRMFGASS